MLELSKIHVHYGVLEAVRGVSMQIPEGSIVGLLGANGSGKSTILKAISGLKRPTRGEIRLDGSRIDGMRTHKIIELGIAHVPEGRKLFPFMSIAENLELGAYLRKDKKEIRRDMEEMAEHFPILKQRWNQRAGNLSGGEQEMLGRGIINPDDELVKELGSPDGNIKMAIGYGVKGAGIDGGNQELLSFRYMAMQLSPWRYSLIRPSVA